MNAAQPQLPAADAVAAILQHTVQVLGLDFNPRQRQQLFDYWALLQRWNQVYNLTAVRDPQGMARMHLADCLAALPAIARAAPRRVLDVGSGGGLPGIVLAIGLPDVATHLVDAVQKKCAFLQQVCGSLGLHNVTVHHARVESLRDAVGFDCITSRAFSDLPLLLRSSRHLLAPGGQWCAMKGKPPMEELARLPADVAAQIEPLQVPGLDAARCLVWLRPDAASSPAQYRLSGGARRGFT